MASRPEIEIRVEAGEPLITEGRTIYPVARVSVFSLGGNILGAWLSPLALVVLEPKKVYVVSLAEGISLEEILRDVPSLRTEVDRALGIYRIRIS